MTSAVDPQPPTPVRAAFALYLGAVVLSVVNAVLQVALNLNGTAVLLGALIEASLFIGFGVSMRAGKLWARVALLAVSGVFVSFSVLAVIALNAAFGQQQDGLVMLTLVFIAFKLTLIVSATVMMYRPGTLGYFG